jgi:hypothetical protein
MSRTGWNQNKPDSTNLTYQIEPKLYADLYLMLSRFIRRIKFFIREVCVTLCEVKFLSDTFDMGV